VKGTQLGEFEELVLLTVALLLKEAYSVAVLEEMERRMERPMSIGNVHRTLQRLEEKGLINSRFGEASAGRGGRRKRLFYPDTDRGKGAHRSPGSAQRLLAGYAPSSFSNRFLMNARPPRWAERLLEWLAAPHLLEELQGDLQEFFHKRLLQDGSGKARFFYLVDLLQLLHPRLWRKKKSPYPPANPFVMLSHSLLLIYRNFRRFKSTFFINLTVLSVGMTCTLLIYGSTMKYTWTSFIRKTAGCSKRC
jgi:hypothetical protein